MPIHIDLLHHPAHPTDRSSPLSFIAAMTVAFAIPEFIRQLFNLQIIAFPSSRLLSSATATRHRGLFDSSTISDIRRITHRSFKSHWAYYEGTRREGSSILDDFGELANLGERTSSTHLLACYFPREQSFTTGITCGVNVGRESRMRVLCADDHSSLLELFERSLFLQYSFIRGSFEWSLARDIALAPQLQWSTRTLRNL